MPAPHIDDETLDQYALGSVADPLLSSVEEHLLVCRLCQSRLVAVDEFIRLFRATATQPDARSRVLWWKLWQRPLVTWAGAAAVMAALLLFFMLSVRQPSPAPATIVLQALRGPEAAQVVTAGKPARLVFDVTGTQGAENYEARIVNWRGDPVFTAPAGWNGDRPEVLVRKLRSGSYWVRLYKAGVLIAEFGLRAE